MVQYKMSNKIKATRTQEKDASYHFYTTASKTRHCGQLSFPYNAARAILLAEGNVHGQVWSEVFAMAR